MTYFSHAMRERPLQHPGPLAGLLALGLLAACGGDADGGPADGGIDAGTMVVEDAGTIPPGAIPCDTDAECDDGAECTDDSCNDRGFCDIVRQNGLCQDDSFCNGRELCDPEAGTADERGCVAGPPETCNDDDVCTLDRCDEENDVCISDPRDFDRDGDVDWFCEGGEDCDDRDPFVNGSINELCNDGRDNDCDGEVDEEDCGRPPHDLCSDALDVSAGGTFVIDARGTAPDYASTFSEEVGFGCSFSTAPDVALRFTIDGPRDVSILAQDTFAAVSLHGTTFDPDAEPERVEEICTTTAEEVECLQSFGDPLRVRNLAAGTYFVLVQDLFGSAEISVRVDLDDPTEPPSNETCASPLDVSAGGVFPGDMVDVANDISRISCSSGRHDLAYQFTIDEPRNVDVRLASPVGESMAFELRTACDDGASAVRCVSGAPATATFFELEAGTYFIVAESFRETDFDLEVQFREPTPPPPGEDCSDPIAIETDTVVDGVITGRANDEVLTCASFASYRDVVYEFELTEEKDVTVVIDGRSTYYAAIRDTCDDSTTVRTCLRGNPSILRSRRLGPGTYSVIVETFLTSDTFTIEVQTADPIEPTDVDGNDICLDAVPVPEDGGYYTGSTILLENDFETRSFCGNFSRSQDATFELSVDATRRILASTAGSGFDTTLHLRSGPGSSVCADADEDGIFDSTELVCNDDEFTGTDTSVIDRTVGPGTYYLVVDGWGTSESGTYELDVLVLDP